MTEGPRLYRLHIAAGRPSGLQLQAHTASHQTQLYICPVEEATRHQDIYLIPCGGSVTRGSY